MNNIHILPERKQFAYPVTVTLHSPGSQKLALVKAIKEFTYFGLLEAKNLVDAMSSYPQVIKAHRTKEEIDKLKQSLVYCDGCKFDLVDIEQMRNRKLIELGLGDINDLIEEVVEQDTLDLLSKSFSYHDVKSFLTERYKLISEENLKQILNID
jgi:DNA-directed RNA polymerase subunit F